MVKIGVSSYSFSRLVRNGVMPQIGVIAQAQEMGFDVIEFSTIAVPSGETLEEFAKKLRAEADRLALPIANYTIGADFLNGSDGDLAGEIERVKGEVRIARILGAPGMRHDATRGFSPEHRGPRSFDAALPRLAEGCRAIAEYAASLGIRTMVENHGQFCQDSRRLEKLADAVDHPNFGLLVDIGNFICADEDPARAVGLLASQACHVHAKDMQLKSGNGPAPGEGWGLTRAGNFFRGTIIGHGDVPVGQCLKTLARNGYDGVISIEFEGMEDVLAGLRIGQANLRRFVADAWQ